MGVAAPARGETGGLVAAPGVASAFDPRRHMGALRELQFWNWGQDIRRAEGNLLLGYGFERRRPPAGQIGSSAYRLEMPRDVCLDLWGFGVLYRVANGSAVYLPRAGNWSACVDPATVPDHVWEPTQVPVLARCDDEAVVSEARQLQRALFRWIAAYERWVIGVAGLDYRRRCLAGRRRIIVPAEQCAIAWDAASDWVERLAPTTGAQRKP